MNTQTATRRTAFVLATAITLSMLFGVNAMSRHEYQRAVLAQAAGAVVAQHTSSTATAERG